MTEPERAPVPGGAHDGRPSSDHSGDALRLEVELERRLGRLVGVGALTSVTLVAAGILLMLLAGEVPLRARAPLLDLSRLPTDLLALRSEGFLWLGVLVALATPMARVLAVLGTRLAHGERQAALLPAGVALALLLATALAVVAR